MTKTYQIHGAGCNGCLKKITKAISTLPEVKQIVGIELDSIIIQFQDSFEYIDINILNQAFDGSRFWLSVVPHIINFELVSEPIFDKSQTSKHN